MENKKRQLAAILFADIVGYTALMQENEVLAKTQLDKFRQVITQQVATKNGQIVNFYGDGCLAIFNAPLDAAQCAEKVQRAFQESPKVPVRIGLHSGTVVVESDNVYGDAVNLTSRIESMGIPSSVLLSERIQKDLKNQPSIQTQALGQFEFKNVAEPMTIFALTNDGLVIPKSAELKGKFKPSTTTTKTRKWLIPVIIGVILIGVLGYWQLSTSNSISLSATNTNEPIVTPLSKEIREKRVAVMVFDNQTMSEELDAFGKMISDWVTRGLMETGEANVISAANIQNQIAKAGLGQGANPEFAANTGVDVMLQGRYYLQENRLIIHANIVEIASGEVIHALTPIEGDKSKMIDLLDQLTQEVLGYWAVKKTKRFLQNPPKYEAYQEFKKAGVLWLDDSQYKNPEKHLKKAYQLDSTFYAPLLSLVPLYLNLGKTESVDSIINFIEAIQPNFTEWESLRFDGLKAIIEGKMLVAGNLAKQRFLMDPSDMTANHNSAHAYNMANHPNKALKVLSDFDIRLRDKDALSNARENWLSTAHLLRGAYPEVIKVAETYPFPYIHDLVARNHLFALAKLGEYDALSPTIEMYNEKKIYGGGSKKRPTSYLYNNLCNDLKVLGQKELLQQYAQQLMTIAQKDNSRLTHLLDMADAAIYLEDWQGAIIHLEHYQSQADISTNFRVISKMGVVYNKLANAKKVNEILAAFDTEKGIKKRNLYYKARVLAAIGEQEEAMESLRTAFQLGRGFVGRHYHFDSFLQPLFDYPPFVEFVKPKG